MNVTRLSTRIALLLATVLAMAGCSKPTPPPETRLLVIDGITIELAELEPFVKFLDSYIPEGGRKAKVRRVLEEQVLPVHLARRAFAAQRRQQLEAAQALCAVATNIAELESQTRQVEDKTRKPMTRAQARLPVAMFLFDPQLMGSVSPPLEVPSGYIVAGCYEIKEGALHVDDHADALQVGFTTHTNAEWAKWLLAEQDRIGGKTTFVHPDYREAMPPWIVLPKLP